MSQEAAEAGVPVVQASWAQKCLQEGKTVDVHDDHRLLPLHGVDVCFTNFSASWVSLCLPSTPTIPLSLLRLFPVLFWDGLIACCPLRVFSCD